MTDTTANIGLSTESVTTVTKILRTLLANNVVLQIKLKQFHWNVRGLDFAQLHSLFDTLQ
jgi:starvation-inducible DNA-binding protein